jgi:hypothetical protein
LLQPSWASTQEFFTPTWSTFIFSNLSKVTIKCPYSFLSPVTSVSRKLILTESSVFTCISRFQGHHVPFGLNFLTQLGKNVDFFSPFNFFFFLWGQRWWLPSTLCSVAKRGNLTQQFYWIIYMTFNLWRLRTVKYLN